MKTLSLASLTKQEAGEAVTQVMQTPPGPVPRTPAFKRRESGAGSVSKRLKRKPSLWEVRWVQWVSLGVISDTHRLPFRFHTVTWTNTETDPGL